MNGLVGIQEAARSLGVSAKTLRRWEAQGRISSTRTAGNQRRYSVQKLKDEVAAFVERLGKVGQG
jgi:excisionase family DNA binding protein